MKVKRLWSSLLAVGMAAALTACGGTQDGGSGGGAADSGGDSGEVSAAESSGQASEGSGETTNVVVAMLAPMEMEDTQIVQDAINEIASERYGVTVTLQYIASGSWTDKINLLLTGSEVDVFAC